MGRELFMLICVQGAWRFLRLKIGYEWFRLFYCTMIHIGKLIEEELHRQERSVTWFANKLYCDRTNTYKIFKRQSIDTELLLRISQVLHVNFLNIIRKNAKTVKNNQHLCSILGYGNNNYFTQERHTFAPES